MKKPRVATPGLSFSISHQQADSRTETARDQAPTFRHVGGLTACVIDRMADAELQHGHTARAEHLAGVAAAMREGAP